jgi:hypothetical protein
MPLPHTHHQSKMAEAGAEPEEDRYEFERNEVQYSVEYDSDLEDFVQLRINDHVHQEWMIPNGPMRQEVIMLFAEQMERELADQEQRELADQEQRELATRSE